MNFIISIIKIDYLLIQTQEIFNLLSVILVP